MLSLGGLLAVGVASLAVRDKSLKGVPEDMDVLSDVPRIFLGVLGGLNWSLDVAQSRSRLRSQE